MKLAAITRTGSYFLTLFLFTLIPSTGNAGQYLPDQPEKIKPYKKVSEHSNLQQTLPSNDEWWQLFKDPILDTLINKAVIKNYDVRNAIRKIEMAKAKLRILSPPKKKIHNNTTNVVNEVLMVRVNVVFKESLNKR